MALLVVGCCWYRMAQLKLASGYVDLPGPHTMLKLLAETPWLRTPLAMVVIDGATYVRLWLAVRRW